MCRPCRFAAARRSALNAMKREGMRTAVKRAYAVLMQVVSEKGPNYQDHLGEMLRRLEEKNRALNIKNTFMPVAL